MKELGYTRVECGDGSGAWAPPKTPKDRAMILASAIIKATQNPDYLKWADKAAMLLDPLGPEEFYKSTLDDYENIAKVLPLLKRDQGKK